MLQGESFILEDYPAPFDLAIALLAGYVVPWLKRVSVSFGFMVGILSSIDVPDIPKIIGCSIPHKAFRSRFDLLCDFSFGIDSFARSLDPVGKGGLLPHSLNILHQTMNTSIAMPSLINLGSSAAK